MVAIRICVLLPLIASPTWAKDSTARAEKLQTPVADLVSVAFQANHDEAFEEMQLQELFASLMGYTP